MKTTPIFLFSILLLGACGGPAARAKRPGAKAQAAAAVQAEPKTYTYRIAATYPHSTGAYTQGLQYVDGTMWEGTASTANRSFGRPTSRRGKPRSWRACPVRSSAKESPCSAESSTS